jgi:glyoxylase-like metal-dependent hydrolase (beta-lactamase superfamily II)
MRIIITLYLLTNSLFSFDYHLKPYTMAENVVCFFGLGAEANQNNGGNIVNSCYAELKDGYVVIDSGPTYSYAQQAYQIMQKRKRLPVRYVVNTSIDDTHILGNSFYKEQGAILIGPKSYDEFRDIKLDQKISSDAFINTRVIPLDRKITKDTKIECCTMRMNINKILDKNDNYLTVSIPDRKLILVGDIIYNNRIPHLKNNRSLLRWIDAIEKIEKSSWDTIISAHGVKTKRNAITSTKSYLLELRDAVMKSIKNGKSRDETINSVKMVSFQDEKLYDKLHRENVENAYNELSKIEKPIAKVIPKKLK